MVPEAAVPPRVPAPSSQGLVRSALAAVVKHWPGDIAAVRLAAEVEPGFRRAVRVEVSSRAPHASSARMGFVLDAFVLHEPSSAAKHAIERAHRELLRRERGA